VNRIFAGQWLHVDRTIKRQNAQSANLKNTRRAAYTKNPKQVRARARTYAKLQQLANKFERLRH